MSSIICIPGNPSKPWWPIKQYGTNANYRDLQRRGVCTHMGRLFGRGHGNTKGIYPAKQFAYDAEQNLYTCPSGQHLYPRRRDPHREVTEYATRKGVCSVCALRTQCTRAKNGRTLMRHDDQDLIETAGPKRPVRKPAGTAPAEGT